MQPCRLLGDWSRSVLAGADRVYSGSFHIDITRLDAQSLAEVFAPNDAGVLYLIDEVISPTHLPDTHLNNQGLAQTHWSPTDAVTIKPPKRAFSFCWTYLSIYKGNTNEVDNELSCIAN